MAWSTIYPSFCLSSFFFSPRVNAVTCCVPTASVWPWLSKMPQLPKMSSSTSKLLCKGSYIIKVCRRDLKTVAKPSPNFTTVETLWFWLINPCLLFFFQFCVLTNVQGAWCHPARDGLEFWGGEDEGAAGGDSDGSVSGQRDSCSQEQGARMQRGEMHGVWSTFWSK